jgi:hypothetical protein
MLFRKIIAVYYENDMKHVNKLSGQMQSSLNVKAGGMYRYY